MAFSSQGTLKCMVLSFAAEFTTFILQRYQMVDQDG